jgi:predicted protein tyrosine phosphatase
VDFRTIICGIEELTAHSEVGVSHVLSILDPPAPEPPAFGAYGEHARLELRFDDVIEEQTGFIAPDAGHVEKILAFGRSLRAEKPGPAHLLVHCHAGISRSSAALTLILAQDRPDRPASEILAEVLQSRDKAWPNLRMIELGDAALGRGGTLIAAVPAVYHFQLGRRPHLEQYFIDCGRRREVDLALSLGRAW